jgi:hypothetical protein
MGEGRKRERDMREREKRRETQKTDVNRETERRKQKGWGGDRVNKIE